MELHQGKDAVRQREEAAQQREEAALRLDDAARRRMELAATKEKDARIGGQILKVSGRRQVILAGKGSAHSLPFTCNSE